MPVDNGDCQYLLVLQSIDWWPSSVTWVRRQSVAITFVIFCVMIGGWYLMMRRLPCPNIHRRILHTSICTSDCSGTVFRATVLHSVCLLPKTWLNAQCNVVVLRISVFSVGSWFVQFLFHMCYLQSCICNFSSTLKHLSLHVVSALWKSPVYNVNIQLLNY